MDKVLDFSSKNAVDVAHNADTRAQCLPNIAATNSACVTKQRFKESISDPPTSSKKQLGNFRLFAKMIFIQC